MTRREAKCEYCDYTVEVTSVNLMLAHLKEKHPYDLAMLLFSKFALVKKKPLNNRRLSSEGSE